MKTSGETHEKRAVRWAQWRVRWRARARAVWTWLKERPYRIVALVGLLVMLGLFGRDVVTSLGVRVDIARLKKDKRELEARIAADSALVRQLDDAAFLERYARENYLMRRAGDEVYIIISD